MNVCHELKRLTAAVATVALLAPVASAHDGHEWGDWADCDRMKDHRVKHCSETISEWDADGATLRVDAGQNGGVSVVSWDKDMVRVQATLVVRADTEEEAEELAADVEIRLEKQLIVASGPESERDRHWSVFYRVWVPKETDLDLIAHNGGVGVKGVSGKMRLSTHNGPLSLHDVSGDVLGRTQNGPVSVELEGDHWQGKGLDAETKNGPVTLRFPEDYSAVLESGTRNGPWDVELPVRVKRGKWFTTELGKGGAPVRVVTSNGPLSIETW